MAGAVAQADPARLPHLLIAGSTGSGKSVGLNTILACLLFRNTPDDLRLVLVDPKRVELSRWGKAPHLLSSVITDPPEVVGALRWLVAEMERRECCSPASAPAT
ncbi:MAG: FtsK/SpoIIIE domain-containing protein [Anaerolineae bacterium]